MKNDKKNKDKIKNIERAIEILEYHEPCTCNNPTITCRYCWAVTLARDAMKKEINSIQ